MNDFIEGALMEFTVCPPGRDVAENIENLPREIGGGACIGHGFFCLAQQLDG